MTSAGGNDDSTEGGRLLVRRIAQYQLILGGLNIHEDLHFSTFYLRASLSSRTQPDYPGYSLIVGGYENGVERYYLRADEAEATSKWLIERCQSDPKWLGDHLRSIEENSERLADAFPPGTSPETFRKASPSELIDLYRRHNELHEALYRVARIPEALDRGVPHFSRYLESCLRAAGVAEGELSTVFDVLTRPQAPSVIAEEEASFNAIALAASDCWSDLSESHTPEMLLPPEVREALRLHRERWGWLSYHGYRDRGLPTERTYALRMVELIASGRLSREKRGQQPVCSPAALEIMSSLDAKQTALFSLFAEIGRVKLQRRFWQLRNFFYLDELLAEMARRIGVSEAILRCCRPEEIIEFLNSGHVPVEISQRVSACAIVMTPDAELVIGGDEAQELVKGLTIQRLDSGSAMVRRGQTACVGAGGGVVRVVTAGSKGGTFNAGDVLACEAADPDLLPMIRRASAVVTQQGGVTSHASVLCRELGVPTVIGIDDLLNFLHDGDIVEVDATRGTVERVGQRKGHQRVALVVPKRWWEDATRVGRKAASLSVAAAAGFRVPPFIVLSFDDCKRALKREDALLKHLLKWCDELDGSGTSSFILRSSALDEDHPSASRAGAYASVQCSLASDPVAAVRSFVDQNGERGYRGSIILQRFVSATHCGVSIQEEPRLDARGQLVVEFVRGPINTVTQGIGSPQRLVYDCQRREMIASVDAQHTDWDFGTLPVAQLLEWLLSVGRRFGTPAYTEWGTLNGDFWLYQVRGGTLRSSKGVASAL